MQHPKRLIWIQTSFLGDLVLSSAAFALAKRSFPAVEQVLITTALGARALRSSKDLDRIIEFDKRAGLLRETCRIAQVLRQKAADSSGGSFLVRPHLSTRSALLALSLRLRLKVSEITFRQASLSSLADFAVERVALFHEAQRVALLLEPLGVARAEILAARPHLEAAELPSGLQALFAAPHPTVAIIPGSVWATKKWPAERYAEVIRWLLKHRKARILLIGAESEAADGAIIEGKLQTEISEVNGESDERFVNLIGRTDLDALRSLYPRVDLVIGNDSSSLHYASSFDRPAIAVFGSTVPAMGFGPLSSKSRVVEREGLACRPCGMHGPQTCPLGHFKCMLDIEPQQVITAIEGFLPL